jgi:hypothetical protein
LVYSRTVEEHLQHLRRVLERLRQHKYYAKRSKCDFLKTHLHFLGHVVGADGLRPDPAKVAAVANWPAPMTVKEVRSFLGLTNYFRRFIEGYSKIVLPIQKLVNKDTPFVWGDGCRQAFAAAKRALSSAPVLALPNFAKAFTVVCDASDSAAGAVLMQDNKPVAYSSHKFSPADARKGAYERELLAVVCALREWRCFLLGAHWWVFSFASHILLSRAPRLKLGGEECSGLLLFLAFTECAPPWHLPRLL